jgi:hypothetical protein
MLMINKVKTRVQNSLPLPSGNSVSSGVGFELDVEVSMSDETEASGLLNIQSVAFSMSPPWRV